jgi:hypothetical protein
VSSQLHWHCQQQPTAAELAKHLLLVLLLTLLLLQEPLSGYEASRQSCIAATRQHLGGLLRSKGLIWVATLPGDMVEWSSAGVLLHLQRAQPWFCSIDKVRQSRALVGGRCLCPDSHDRSTSSDPVTHCWQPAP